MSAANQPRELFTLPGVIGLCPAMQAVAARVRQVAGSRSSVLIVGETGTGKELVARALHELSPRADGPYIRVNCGALSEGLLESELFGHIKGAFTGAVDNKTGRFEAAHTGTIFLDEISSMSPKLQVKLLRVLQEREFERVGESRTIRVNVRVIAATNQHLEDEVDSRRFREDLYYRINVVPVYLPPLRERKEDIPRLVEFFVRRYADENGKQIEGIDQPALDWLKAHPWPGNVREVEHTIERAVVLSQQAILTLDLFLPQTHESERKSRRREKTDNDFPGLVRRIVQQSMHSGEPGAQAKLYDYLVGGLEKELIQQVLQECNGVQTRAAHRLGINRNTLHKKMLEYGISERDDG